ncbi:GNAT family N-acetyltransferase [Amycolatopsis sp. K13G38]|uniref:GNAT family N-acetyltransferase n=1 Tax=Amycolatopsis acididurans TaxID=2724524 RepID=A0ABX1J1Z4_9PSEU|nr:GNAT family N-acetyltransferase [Amycolatopsis acididurans]NKQ53783.1 GNAT family N-acetyltransferase [Amycolatopsis acididurans]
MEPAETLSDGEIRLRRWRRGDARTVHRVVNASLDHLAPFMPWAVGGYSRADAADFIRSSDEEWRAGKAFSYAVLGARGEVIGSCGLMRRIAEGGLEIGYWLAREHTGRGIATRAARLLTDEAFRIGARHVEIHHDPANIRSGLIPERLGYTRIGTMPATQPGGSAGTGKLVVWRAEVNGC